MKLPIIQSLWIGAPLSNLEKLCIQSFLDNGHEFHLYVYDDVPGIPDGCIIKDGNEILHSSEIFNNRRGGIAPFSDWFRYTMLYKRGGFWVDMDVVCVKPFAFESEVVLSQHVVWPHSRFANFVLGFSPMHPAMLELSEQCKQIGNTSNVVKFWELLTPIVEKHNLAKFAQPPLCFSVPADSFLDYYPNGIDLPAATHSVHVANSKFGKQEVYDKNDKFHEHSLFELLKEKHGIKNTSGAKTVTPEVVVSAREMGRVSKIKKQRKQRRNRRTLLAIVAFAAGLLIGLAI